MTMEDQKLSSSAFYNEYHGHRVVDLEIVRAHLLKLDEKVRLIYLAGDSSLDNKFWFTDEGDAVNGYELLLNPPVSRKDIAYWMNVESQRRGLYGQWATINCSVEESTIGSRACCRLLEQDRFIRDNLGRDDVLVISVGGNDIALHPSCCTAVSTLSLVCCTSTSCLKHLSCGCAIPVDDCCAGCGCSLLSCLCAFPPGMGYFIHLFGTRIQSLVSRMTSTTRPRLIVICMIYFLDEKPGNSWAEWVLRLLGYNSNPEKLQEIIRQVFRLATQRIRVPGSEVVAVPLFETLDGKNTADYCQRVEPSAQGGEKMGKQLMDAILGAQQQQGQPTEDEHAEITLANGL